MQGSDDAPAGAPANAPAAEAEVVSRSLTDGLVRTLQQEIDGLRNQNAELLAALQRIDEAERGRTPSDAESRAAALTLELDVERRRYACLELELSEGVSVALSLAASGAPSGRAEAGGGSDSEVLAAALAEVRQAARGWSEERNRMVAENEAAKRAGADAAIELAKVAAMSAELASCRAALRDAQDSIRWREAEDGKKERKAAARAALEAERQAAADAAAAALAAGRAKQQAAAAAKVRALEEAQAQAGSSGKSSPGRVRPSEPQHQLPVAAELERRREAEPESGFASYVESMRSGPEKGPSHAYRVNDPYRNRSGAHGGSNGGGQLTFTAAAPYEPFTPQQSEIIEQAQAVLVANDMHGVSGPSQRSMASDMPPPNRLPRLGSGGSRAVAAPIPEQSGSAPPAGRVGVHVHVPSRAVAPSALPPEKLQAQWRDYLSDSAARAHGSCLSDSAARSKPPKTLLPGSLPTGLPAPALPPRGRAAAMGLGAAPTAPAFVKGPGKKPRGGGQQWPPPGEW